MTDIFFSQTEQHDLRVVDVAVEPAVERAQLRANQDEGCGYICSLDQSMKVIHHPEGSERRDTGQEWVQVCAYKV